MRIVNLGFCLLLGVGAHATLPPKLPNARLVARALHDDIQENHPDLRRTVVASSACGNGPCLVIYARSTAEAERLKVLFGREYQGLVVRYDFMSFESGVAFEPLDAGERMRLATEELGEYLLDRPGVSAIAQSAGGVATGVVVSVADAETERALLAEYPPGTRVFEVPVVIERAGRFDARDPVVTSPCEPTLVESSWGRLRRRVRRLFNRPLN